MLKRILAVVFLGGLVLGAVIALRTFLYQPEPPAATRQQGFDADIDRAADHLAQAVRFRTISTDLAHADFRGFLAFVQSAFPASHARLERIELDPVTPLYKWSGSSPDLQPVLLAAHYDVVPIAAPDQWTYPPFDGVIEDGFVWGRGTLDNKGALIALMSVVERLIADGFTPRRDIYLSFGGDEEVGGEGAKAVAEYLRSQGVQLAWALDEGSFVLDKVIPGLDAPVASINLSEKGYVTMTLVARGAGGHSSMPPRETAVSRLASALHRLRENPVPGGISGVSAEFFDALGRHFSLGKRAIFANRWLFDPVLETILSGAPSTDAMLRSTTAPTMLSGSPKENVLATKATATINFRIHPRDTIASLEAHVRAAIADDAIEIIVDHDHAAPASPVSASDGPGYLDIRAAIHDAFGPIASVPGLTIAATDARHYARAADAAYRINPFIITGEDLTRFHGIDERLSLDNIAAGIRFYAALIKRQ